MLLWGPSVVGELFIIIIVFFVRVSGDVLLDHCTVLLFR
jgi:hypothetical protein